MDPADALFTIFVVDALLTIFVLSLNAALIYFVFKYRRIKHQSMQKIGWMLAEARILEQRIRWASDILTGIEREIQSTSSCPICGCVTHNATCPLKRLKDWLYDRDNPHKPREEEK